MKIVFASKMSNIYKSILETTKIFFSLKAWQNRKKKNWSSETNFNGASTVVDQTAKKHINCRTTDVPKVKASGGLFPRQAWDGDSSRTVPLVGDSSSNRSCPCHKLLTLIHSSFAIQPNGMCVSW